MATAVDTTVAGALAAPAISPFRRNFNLARELAWTQFKLKYAGSVLGYLWSLVKPAMMFTILYVIFVKALKVKGDEFPLQLLVGIVLFNFFTECTSAGLYAIAGNGDLIRKAFFPRYILVVASSMSAGLTLAINFLLILGVATPLGHLHLGVRSLAIIPLFVELYVFALGMSLILASFFVFYRDLGHIWEIVGQVLFYASAVVFPITYMPLGLLHVVFLNPLAQIIEDARHAIVTPSVPWTANVVSATQTVVNPVTQVKTVVPEGELGIFMVLPILIAVALLGIGYFIFRRLSPQFAEEL